MRKVNKKERQVEVASPKKNTGSNPSRSDKLVDALSNLDPAQFVQLTSSVVGAYRSSVDLSKEKEKTKRTEMDTELGFAKIKTQEKESQWQYEQGMTALYVEDAKDQRRHEEFMQELQATLGQQGNEHEQILKVLALVEEKRISPEFLAQLIYQIKNKAKS